MDNSPDLGRAMAESAQNGRIRDLERRVNALEMQIAILRSFIARLAAPAGDIAAMDADIRNRNLRDPQ